MARLERGGNGQEMLVVDKTIPDEAHQMKAIYQFKYDGDFAPDALPLPMRKRPEEEQEFYSIATSTKLYNGVAVGLMCAETLKGQAQGSSFNLTPPLPKQKGISLTANHNLVGHHQRVASTVHGAKPSQVSDKEWMSLEVLARGNEKLPDGWKLNMDFSSPETSPDKGLKKLDDGSEPQVQPEDLLLRLDLVRNPVLGDSDMESVSETSSWLEDQEVAAREVELEAAAKLHGEEAFRAKARSRERKGEKVMPKERVPQVEEKEADQLAEDSEAAQLAELAERRSQKEADRAFRNERAKERMKQEDVEKEKLKRDGPDAAFVEHAWCKAAVKLSDTFFVMDPEEPELAQWTEEEGWRGGDNMVGIGCPAEDANEDYFRDVYNMTGETARQYVEVAKHVYDRLQKGASPGKAIAATENSLRVTCSFLEGSSGCVVSKVKTPLAAVGMHVRMKKEERGDRFSASNIAVNVNSDWVVLYYGRLVVPRLVEQLTPGVWPKGHEGYMKEKLQGYLAKHRALLTKYELWGECEKLLELVKAA